tara:strand:+ start:232 stop:1293 length:1062 start_codon:yes stop_codon:yes gene_type:complete
MNFSNKVISWYNNNKEDFPWRMTKDPYKIWVSEIMLQQTQVKTVIPYYEKWIKKFPTIVDVANAPDEILFKYWEGLGYYNRVNNFRIACNQIINDYNGKIPETKDELITLKGIGDYTSSAISSIAFNKVNYVIDGNVKRVMARVLRIKILSKLSLKKINKFLTSNIDQSYPGSFNQALMDLGRDICKPKKPLCEICPISSFCMAYIKNQISKYPAIQKKTNKFPHYTIGVGVIWNKNKILITKRKKNALLGGLWEFPGGKILKNESIENCVKREIYEELSINVDILKFITKVKHSYSHFRITLHAYHCIYKKGKIVCNASDDWKWITPNQFKKFAFPKANHHIFPHILNQEAI